MRRTLPLALCVLLTVVPVMAGEVNVPSNPAPPQPPPACTENCTSTTTTTSTTDTATTEILLWLLTIVSR